ncbi:MAG: multifunctional CCA addition/repair protein [Synoicihabitans sp.]
MAHTDFDTLAATLATFGATDVVGRSFGTIKLRLGDDIYDFSLPRRESKIGSGHRGFKIEPEPNLDDAAAAARRDFTINAMAWDPFDDELVDPFGGKRDLEKGILRHTSPAFVEDPLRVLRAMQFAARLDLLLANETIELARSIAGKFIELPVERVWGEWEKWACQSVKPSRGIEVLRQTGWIEHFPEIAKLIDCPQDPEWHPEGDVYTHTNHCLDALVAASDWEATAYDRRQVLMFATLAHDFGKPATTEKVEKHGQWRWTSPNHAFKGIEPTQTFLTRIGAPHRLAPQVAPLVQFHMAHINGGSDGLTDNQVRRLARKLEPARIEDLVKVMQADTLGRPPRESLESLRLIELLGQSAAALAVEKQAPAPYLRGRDLIDRGLSPGPQFSEILRLAFEAQLTGTFDNHTDALTWLDSYLKNQPS